MTSVKRNLYIILTLGLLIRLVLIFNGHYISPDGTQYASLGYHLFHDFRYVSNGAQFPDIIQPPLYPFLLGAFTFFLRPEYAGKIISLIFGLALIWAMFRFTDRLTGNQKLALSAGVFVAVNPALAAVSSQVATEALYLFLLFYLYGTVLFYLKTRTLGKILVAGLLTGLIYLTRPEGLLYFGIILLILILWRQPWRHLMVYGSIVLGFFLVYAVATYPSLGYWTISPKLSFIKAQGTTSRYFLQQDQEFHRKTNPKVHLQRFRYALAPDKKDLAANELFKKNEAALKHFKNGKKNGANRKYSVKRFALHLSANLTLAAKKFVSGWAFPWGFWFFLLFGLWRFPFKKWKREIIFSAIFVLPVGAVLFSNVEQRFLYIIPVILTPILGRGLLQADHLLTKSIHGKTGKRIIRITLYALIILSVYPAYSDIWHKTRAKDYYYQVAQWLKHEVPQEKVIAASVPQAVFFADRKYAPLPYAPLDSLELYLRHNRVAFILLDVNNRQLHPALKDVKHLPSFLDKKESIKIRNKNFVLLRVKKESAHERTNANH